MGLTTPFAQNGDKKAIPQNTSDGSVSFDRGFGSFYALPPEEGGLFIDRAQFNQLMYDTTSQVLENKQQIATQANRINEVNTTLTQSINTKANQATTYTKSEVDNLLNVKANWNAVVALSGNQTIAGVKTFTSNISSPNITNLQMQMNSIVGGGNTPFLVKDTAINITAGVGGNFSKLTDALEYCKQNIHKKIDAIPSITLLSDFSDDLLLIGFPTVSINCNNHKLAGKLSIFYSTIIIEKLKIDKGLTALGSAVYLYNGVTAGSSDEQLVGFGSSIFANSSFISISGDVILNPSEKNYGIFSKGTSHIYLVNPSTYTQTTGRNFATVIGGGIISTDGSIRLDGVTVSKASQPANVMTTDGIIMGTQWS